ncbi:Homocysteine s-methyltransferase [Pleurostoma richardsiae]|uniref:Homocysteine s-methyltransferase n=1 Tax=Pleurostoma richardsiae TaxID=41990 RepID=A0AA38RVP0_9PEZI|nr:Homocysteine s-methyltransferase [Pleurostoma richardsiae]
MADKTPVLILDGGLGTSLEDKYGVSFSSASTPLWSSHLLVSDPETLLRCQRDFGDCPVDVIETATYQVSIDGFTSTKTEGRPNGVDLDSIPDFLERAVQIANEAKGKAECRIALSLGPYGACMIPSQEYSGAYDKGHDTAEKLREWHLQRLHCFTKVERLFDRVQFVAFETLPRTDEIVAVRSLYDQLATSGTFPPEFVKGFLRTPFWISCVFPGDDDMLPDGSSVYQAVETMLSPNISAITPWGIGINCTKINKLPSIIEAYERAVVIMVTKRKLSQWPSLVLYPDGTNGEVYNTETQRWELPEGNQKPDIPWEIQLANVVEMAANRGRWRSILVGGCCKTSHQDIKNLIRAIGV